jgi:iron(III) transport system permease protein
VTVLVIVFGVIIGNFSRLVNTKLSKLYSRVGVVGYSIPASIIAVAVMTFFMFSDKMFKPIYALLNLKGNFLMGRLIMLIFSLTLRFMAIGFNSIESGFNKMGMKYYEASILLGKSGLETFVKVDIPLLKPALFSAAILTFVDVLKELPLTLILRPFNYDTLATKVFVYAGDEMIHEASVYALMIIGISGLSLLMMQYFMREKKHVKNR